MEKIKPSVFISLDHDSFNKMMELVSAIASKDENTFLDSQAFHDFVVSTRKLKDKIMTYSYVKNNKACINFFPKEASNLIFLLVNAVEIEMSDLDYFEIMKEDAEERYKEYKDKNNTEEN